MSRRLIVITGAILAALGVISILDRITDTLFLRICLLVSLIIVVMVVGVALRRDRQMPFLVDPMILLFIFMTQFFVVGPIGIHIWGHANLPILNTYAYKHSVSVLTGFLLMLVMMVIGHQLHLNEIIAGKLPRFEYSPRKLPGIVAERILLFGNIAGCIGWIQYQGGLMAKLSKGYGVFKPGGAVFTIAHIGLLIGTLLLFWRIINSPRRRRGTLVLFLGVLLFDIIFYGFIFGVRKYLLFLFFGTIAIWLLRRGFAALPKLRTVTILVLLVIFFAFWGSIRHRPLTMILQGRESANVADNRSAQRSYLHGMVEPYGTACMVYELFPDHEPFRWGSTLQVTLFGFIPRAIWPEKPIGIGKELTRYVVGPFYELHGFSIGPTIPGDFYLNFGWAGFLVGGLLLGVMCRTCTIYAVRHMKDGKQMIAARVLLPAVMIMGLGEIRATMAAALAFYIMAFFPLLFALTFFNLDQREPSESS